MAVSGVDSCVTFFKYEQKWSSWKEERKHTHDVRALITTQRKHKLEDVEGYHLISGGIDTNLVVTELRTSKTTEFNALPHQSPCSVAWIEQEQGSNFMDYMEPTRVLLFQQRTWLELWKIGQLSSSTLHPTNPRAMHVNAKVDEDDDLQLLLKLAPASREKKSFFITCSSISPNGKYVAVSDCNCTKIYSITYEGPLKNHLQVQPIVHSQQACPPATALAFSKTSGSDILILATRSGIIQMIDISSGAILARFGQHKRGDEMVYDEEEEGEEEEGDKEEDDFEGILSAISFGKRVNIRALAVSKNGKWLASGDANRVHVFDLERRVFYATLPDFKAGLSTLDFSPNSEKLLVALTDKTFLFYNVMDKEIDDWSVTHKVPSKLTRRKGQIVGIAFDPVNHSSVVLYGHSFVYHLDYERNVWSVREYPFNRFYFDFLSGTETLSVDITQEKIQETLPPPFYRHKFNT